MSIPPTEMFDWLGIEWNANFTITLPPKLEDTAQLTSGIQYRCIVVHCQYNSHLYLHITWLFCLDAFSIFWVCLGFFFLGVLRFHI